MDRRQDPRSIVTPYAFAVHPDLLGRPLATPWQRLGAILIDLVVIGFLSLVGGGPLAFASALLLLWLAFKKPGRDVLGKLFRIAVGCLGVLILLVAIGVVYAIRNADEIANAIDEETAELTEGGIPAVTEGASGDSVPVVGEIGFREAMAALQGLGAFRGAETREEAQEVAGRLARDGLAMDLSRSEIRNTLAGMVPEDAPWANESDEIIAEAMLSLPGPEVTAAPEEIGDPAAAVGAETTDVPPAAEETAPAIVDAAALDSIAALNERIAVVREQRDDYRDRLENAEEALAEAESGGIFAWLWDLIDELGLGFGWAALYMTVTHAWWKGTSVGKRLFRIRVVMIDKRPLNWWLSFERAGGYAAGFATGLLGFVQIFWDPNRQAIHDKVSETIVIQDDKDPIPGPWVEEGRAQWAREGARQG